MKMFYVTVTLRNGARVSGVLNARSEHDARRQVRDTIQGRTARTVVVVSTF